MARKKKRKAPRKAAVTQAQVLEQLNRYESLLNKWLDEQDKLTKRQVLAQKKIKAYRAKVKYYRGRLEITDDHGVIRPLRSIQVDAGEPEED